MDPPAHCHGTGLTARTTLRSICWTQPRVKDVVIGEGAPTIVVPVTGRTPEVLREQIAAVADRADVVEWRVDFFHTVDDVASVVAQAGALAEQLQGTLPGPLKLGGYGRAVVAQLHDPRRGKIR